MDMIKETIIVVAAFVVIVGGAIYISTHMSAGCVDLFFYKSCGIVTHPN